MSSTLDKQHELLKLIVQKMEIKTEADERDEGFITTGIRVYNRGAKQGG